MTILGMYGRVHSIQKPTLDLPEDLKGKISRLASTRGISEAQLIRDALSRMVETVQSTSRAVSAKASKSAK